MASTFKLKVAGLFLDDNSLDESPEGALADATNLVCRKPDVLESRRGFANLIGTLIGGLPSVVQVFLSRTFGVVFALGSSNRLYNFSGGAWNSPGSVTLSQGKIDSAAQFNYKAKFVDAFGALWGSFVQGIYKVDALANAPTLAGVPRGLDALAGTTGSGWLASNTQVAYRTIFVRYDANNNRAVSAPSGRVIVQNTSGSAVNGHLYIPVPADILATDYVEVYRTKATALTVDPGEEMQLCYSAPLAGTAGGGTNPAPGNPVGLTDVCPESQLGATGYFCPSQDGIIQEASRPPLANDIALFKDSMFFGGVKQRGQAILQLIAVPSDGDTITIGGVTYTWKTTPVSGGHVGIYSAGSLSQNITQCANNLIYTINNDGFPSTGTVVSTVYASYISSPTDNPGKILFENITPGPFTISGSGHTSNWFPNIATAVTSSGQYKGNRLMWSKYGQPEAVPYLNYQDIGSEAADIERVITLRDSLLIFKADGCWRLTGAGGNWNIQPLDPNLWPMAPESLVALNNRVFGFFNQGICAVSDGGAQSISFDRVDDLLASLPGGQATAFGVRSEAEHQYVLVYNSGLKALSYNIFTDAWTNYRLASDSAPGCGHGGHDGVIRLGTGGGRVLSELHNNDGSDQFDSRYTTTITSVVGNVITVSGIGGLVFGPGDGIYQQTTPGGPVAFAKITGGSGPTFTVGSSAIGFLSGFPCDLGSALAESATWQPTSAGQPDSGKQFQKLTAYVTGALPTDLTARFASDIQGGSVATAAMSVSGNTNPGVATTLVPRDHARSNRLSFGFSHATIFEKLSIVGVALKLRVTGEGVLDRG